MLPGPEVSLNETSLLTVSVAHESVPGSCMESRASRISYCLDVLFRQGLILLLTLKLQGAPDLVLDSSESVGRNSLRRKLTNQNTATSLPH